MRISDWSSDVCSSDLPVDREMLADRAQEGDVFERVEPLGIVEHHRIRWPVAEGQEPFEDALDRGDIGLDAVLREQLAGLVLEARVADLAGAAAWITLQENNALAKLDVEIGRAHV